MPYKSKNFTRQNKEKHLIQIFLTFSVLSLNLMSFPKVKPSAQKTEEICKRDFCLMREKVASVWATGQRSAECQAQPETRSRPAPRRPGGEARAGPALSVAWPGRGCLLHYLLCVSNLTFYVCRLPTEWGDRSTPRRDATRTLVKCWITINSSELLAGSNPPWWNAHVLSAIVILLSQMQYKFFSYKWLSRLTVTFREILLLWFYMACVLGAL